jgi:hypothetical protein
MPNAARIEQFKLVRFGAGPAALRELGKMYVETETNDRHRRAVAR